MKQFQILRYLKKYQAIIAIGSIIAGILFYGVAQKRLQTYTAATVIEYTNKGAEDGLAPDDTKIDPSEITSSNIVTRALQNLGVDVSSVNIDSIRSGIKVEEIITQEQRQTQEAKIDLGEEYEIHPTKYLVSFSAGVDWGKEFPKRVLDEVLDVYMSWYGENHVNQAGSTNEIDDVYSKNYDYIEMMEVIEDSLEETLDQLSARMENSDGFRSYTTGYTFYDLYDDFRLLRYMEAPAISANILHNTITKDRDVLLAKYRNRNNSLTIDNEVSAEETDKIIQIIDTYVEMMSSSDNTNITSEYILQELQENYGYDSEGKILHGTDQTTEYDKLLRRYAENRTQYEGNRIDIAYNKYVIKKFKHAKERSPEDVLAKTEEQIKNFAERVTSFYEILDKTNDEYNEYLGAQNIAMLSSVGVSEKMPVRTFTIFVILIFGVFGCAGAVLLGRIEDIVDYYAFTNKVDGLPNRAKCDRFIAAQEKNMLRGYYSCIVLRMTNLQAENLKKGRNTGDYMMKEFANTLTSIFIPSDKIFVGNNGSGMYLVFAEDMTQKQAENALEQMHTVLEQKGEESGCSIEFISGCAEATEEKCYYIRKLLSIAIGRLGKNTKDKTETQDRETCCQAKEKNKR